MNREHSHHHHHAPTDFNRAFAIGVVLNTLFIIAEVIGGFMADSLALLTDAGHNISDVLGLLLAWGASALAGKSSTLRRTYGYSRGTILAALGSGLLLLAAVGAIVFEAIGRLQAPVPTGGAVMMIIAGIGVVINGVTAWLFVSGKDHDLNIRGAFLHMAADAAVSLGVVLAGLAILATGWLWIDPALSILIGLIILLSTWGLLRDSFNLAMDAVPGNIDAEAVREHLLKPQPVIGLHDLHIWAMSTTETALTAHLIVQEPLDQDRLLRQLSHDLQHEFGIGHATLQIERDLDAVDCAGC